MATMLMPEPPAVREKASVPTLADRINSLVERAKLEGSGNWEIFKEAAELLRESDYDFDAVQRGRDQDVAFQRAKLCS